MRFTCGEQANAAGTCPDNTYTSSYRDEVVRALAASAPSYPSALRYLSLDCSPAGDSPWRYDFLASEGSQEITTPPDLHWWSLEGVGPSRVATVLDAAKGEKIAAYLRSVRYSYSVPFEGTCMPIATLSCN